MNTGDNLKIKFGSKLWWHIDVMKLVVSDADAFMHCEYT
jgi:hypothetical protein